MKNSAVYTQIKKFYFEGLRDTVDFPMPQISQKNILDSTQNEFGIFSFQIHTSNDRPRLYLRDFGTNTIEILKEYNLEFLFKRIFKYFKVNEANISYAQKLDCSSKIIELLYTRQR